MALKDRGQVAASINIATMAIVLIIVVIVIGALTTNLGASLTGSTLDAYRNITGYTWQALILLSVGIILFAGMSLISMMYGKRQ